MWTTQKLGEEAWIGKVVEQQPPAVLEPGRELPYVWKEHIYSTNVKDTFTGTERLDTENDEPSWNYGGEGDKPPGEKGTNKLQAK